MTRRLVWKLLALFAMVGLVPRTMADVAVYVAYMENERPSLFTPDPWAGSANTIFLGYTGPDHDAGAILLRNTGSTNVVLGPGATVDGFANGASFQLWDTLIGTGVTIKPGQNLILTETASRNFDTSDQPQLTDVTQRNNAIPKIHLTLNGVSRVFADTAQVLNTGGIDPGDSFSRNESLQWRPIGTTGIEDPAGTGLMINHVLTQHNDNARTGQMISETTLGPSNVSAQSFGKLFTQPIDGYAYAQPLVWPRAGLGKLGLHDLVYVATMHNSVYAFEANTNVGIGANPIWHVNLGPSYPASVNGCGDTYPENGIVGTPVLDTASATLYVIAKTYENGNAIIRLHALNAYKGTEKFGGPVVISGSVPGKGDGGDGTNVPFLSSQEQSRPGLLLVNGVLYIAFGSHCDFSPYHGWLFAYDAKTLQQLSIFNSTPDGGLGGIWMSGCGPAADAAGNLYLVVGNGTFSKSSQGNDYGECVLKFGTTAGMPLKDWFAPFNQDYLNAQDLDFGSAGLTVLPDSVGSKKHLHLLIAGSKDGRIYLLDRDHMGNYNPTADSQIVQSLPNAIGGAWSSPAYFNGSIYYQGSGDVLKRYSIQNGQMSTSPVSASNAGIAYPGATPSISANNTQKAIVWTVENAGNAVLHAYDATDLTKELYNSQQNPQRDGMSGYVKFTLPTICNGKVYVCTQDGLNVFGGGFFADPPSVAPGSGIYPGPVSVTITPPATPGAVVRYTTDGSDPTATSPVYSAPFTVSACGVVKARAFAYGFKPSAVTQEQLTIDPNPAYGDGLWGTYFSNIDLTGTTYSQADPTINFNWNGASPVPGIGGSNWSGRWTGQVQVHCSGPYTFYTNSDDGVRLWVNGQLLIDDWTYHGPTWDQGTVVLTGGQKYDVKIEYFQGGGGSLLQFAWSSPFFPWQIIPQSQLYSGHLAPPAILPAGGTFSKSISIALADLPPDASIYYTLNGADPTQNSTLYTKPFTITASTTVKAKAFKTGLVTSPTASATFTLNNNTPTYQINSGGGAAAPYAADNFVTGGGVYMTSGTVDTSLVSQPAPQNVYLSERWGPCTYTFPNLTALSYTVRLHFAEIYWNAPAQRVFNVTINGASVLSNFDIVAATGSNFKAICKEFTARPDANGNITVQLQSVVDNPKISGIELIPIGRTFN